jgi:two-component system CheB/CheR fusion protein
MMQTSENDPSFVGLVHAQCGAAHCKILPDGSSPNDYEYLEVNPLFEKLTGLKDVVGKRVSEVVPGIRERDGELLENLIGVAATGEPKSFELYVQFCKQWLSFSAYSPRPGHFISTFQSTTDQHLAAELAHSEQQIRSVLSAMGEGLIVHDQDGTIINCNPAAERILGLTRSQLEGRTPMDRSWRAIRDDGTPFPASELPAMVTLRTGQPLTSVIMGVRRPDDSLAWLSVTSRPLRHSPEAAPYAVVATFSDITALREAKKDLAELSAQLTFVLDGSTDGFFDWEIPTDRVVHSASWAAMLGYSLEELQPSSSEWKQRIHPDDRNRVLAATEAVLRGEKQVFDCEYRIRHKEGHWLWVRSKAKVAQRDAGGAAIRFAGVVSNISQRKLSELLLLASLDQNVKLVNELHASLEHVRTLTGLLPICMYCKRVRAGENYWQEVADYISAHSDLLFSHGLCPECRNQVQAKPAGNQPLSK